MMVAELLWFLNLTVWLNWSSLEWWEYQSFPTLHGCCLYVYEIFMCSFVVAIKFLLLFQHIIFQVILSTEMALPYAFFEMSVCTVWSFKQFICSSKVPVQIHWVSVWYECKQISSLYYFVSYIWEENFLLKILKYHAVASITDSVYYFVSYILEEKFFPKILKYCHVTNITNSAVT